jgi:uncharacterized protein involved in exopolysaccharide biosynthesis
MTGTSNEVEKPESLAPADYDEGTRPTSIVGDPRLHQIREFVEEAETDTANPLTFVKRTFRGRIPLTAVLALVTGALFGCLGYFGGSPLFESYGLIRLAAKEPKILYADQDDARLRLFDAFVAGEVTYLRSRPVLERALAILREGDKAHLATSIDAEDFAKSVLVKREKGLIHLAGQSSDAEIAASTVNAVIDAYQALSREQSDSRQQIRVEELQSRESELLDRLRQINVRLLEVGGEYGTQSIAKAHLRKVAQLEDLEQRLSELRGTIGQQEAAGSMADLDTGDGEIKRATLLDRAMADMTFERVKKAAILETLRLRYQSNHAKIRRATAELAVIDNAIEQRRTQIATLGKTGALTAGNDKGSEKSILELKSLLDKLTMRRDEFRTEARALNSKLVELTFLQEERREMRLMLDETRRALERVLVEGRNSLPGSIEIKARGGVPLRPVHDKRKKFAAAGAFVGAGAALGLVILLALVSSRCRFSDELEPYSAMTPLLGVVPESVSDTSNQFDEAVHRLRNELSLSFEKGSNVIAVTNAESGSGASAIAWALARSFALAQLRTAIIDGDITNRSLSIRHGLDDTPGFSDLADSGDVSSIETFIQEDNLTIVSAGTPIESGEAGLSWPRAVKAVELLRSQFEVVIIDAGSMDRHLAAQLHAAAADRLLLVVGSGLPSSSISQAVSTSSRMCPGNSFIIFNRAKFTDPGLSASGAIAA